MIFADFASGTKYKCVIHGITQFPYIPGPSDHCLSIFLWAGPSTDGPPFEYRSFSKEGGSPLSTIINWQFDGASLNFDLDELSGIPPGAAFKLCYSVGFEGDWGNASSLSATQPDVNDLHMFGFISTLYNNDVSSLVLNYARAWDITDGFTGFRKCGLRGIFGKLRKNPPLQKGREKPSDFTD